jgi:isopenicillin N synthase-like dioxygenase
VKDVNDTWISIDPIPNTFVINIGDILEKMTRSLYKSTPHRVKNTLGKSRFSIPYFYDPGWDQEIKELDIKVSEDETNILAKNSNYKRWDNVNL